MGVLVPLYLAGLSALSLPLIFHLVRRTPRSRQVFSSLMFLAPTVPRLTRRSRVDQWVLLGLRLAALALLAFAFSRPFLREVASLTFGDLPGRRVAILMDVSGSMQRGDLWKQALRQAERELSELNPQDDVALYTFAEVPETIIGFDTEESERVANKPQLVRSRLATLRPGWGATDLGGTLVSVVSEIDSSIDARQLALEPLVVVVSDFQKGSKIEALTSFEWPARARLLPRPVAVSEPTNAFVQVMQRDDEEENAAEIRVRVVNAEDSRREQFYVNWGSSAGREQQASEVAVYVPPGQTRVVRLARTAESVQADRIVLRGDDQDFDNTFYVVPPRKQAVRLLYVGADAADDAQGLQFYLRLAVANDPLRQVEVIVPDGAAPLSALHDPTLRLVVFAQMASTEWQAALRTFVEGGGWLVLVPANGEAGESLPQFFDDVELLPEAPVGPGKYLLLGQIDFAHPLFAPFASPRYSDFTKIHFWKHRRLSLKTPAVTRVIARFDNGEPALLERGVGKGGVIGLTSGWQPADSQMAVSTKFVPLIGGLLDRAFGGAAHALLATVNEPVSLSAPADDSPVVIHTPDGSELKLAAGQKAFIETRQPGIYRIENGVKLAATSVAGAAAAANGSQFAINLAGAESNTATLELEQLEQRGVRIGDNLSRAERYDRVRQQRDMELETRQKVWRWLIVAALAVLVLETWWGGRAERQITDTTRAVA